MYSILFWDTPNESNQISFLGSWALFSLFFKFFPETFTHHFKRLLFFSPDTLVPSRSQMRSKRTLKRLGTKWTKFSQLSDWLYGQTCAQLILDCWQSLRAGLSSESLRLWRSIISIYVTDDRSSSRCVFWNPPKGIRWMKGSRKEAELKSLM